MTAKEEYAACLARFKKDPNKFEELEPEHFVTGFTIYRKKDGEWDIIVANEYLTVKQYRHMLGYDTPFFRKRMGTLGITKIEKYFDPKAGTTQANAQAP